MGQVSFELSERINLSSFSMTSICRLAAWTCLGDCHFNICFNSPLHLDVSDVIVNLPCGKALFDAESAAEFERLAPSERTSQRPTCLRDLIHCLRKDSWLNPGSEKYKSVTVLHLLMAISGQ